MVFGADFLLDSVLRLEVESFRLIHELQVLQLQVPVSLHLLQLLLQRLHFPFQLIFFESFLFSEGEKLGLQLLKHVLRGVGLSVLLSQLSFHVFQVLHTGLPQVLIL